MAEACASARRGRRRVVGALLGAIGAVTLAVGPATPAVATTAPHTGTPSRPVDRDIDDYVLFALDRLEFKGGRDAGRGYIRGGDVGVNATTATEPVLSLCKSHPMVMDDGTQVVGPAMSLTDDCSVWDVYTNALSGRTAVQPRNSGPTAYSAPIVASDDLPAIPPFACNPAEDILIPVGKTAVLVPGVYGNVRIRNWGTIVLQPGTYSFCNWWQGNKAKVTTAAGTVVQIEHSLRVGNHSTIGTSCGTRFWVRGDVPIRGNGTTVQFGFSTKATGQFWNLAGGTELGTRTDLAGRYWARWIHSGINVNVTGCD